MKLLIIVLCLLSERYLVHAVSHNRFSWFAQYFDWINQKLPQSSLSTNSYFVLGMVILPIVLLCWIILLLFNHVLFGLFGFLLSFIIFYYCLGPENSFYPINNQENEQDSENVAGNYFVKVNSQLFAVIFWFIVLGPMAVLVYRLLCLCKYQTLTQQAAGLITGWLDWITTRITMLLYLLVGNFQRGFHYYSSMFLTSPEHNEEILRTGGLLVARSQDEEVVTLPHAQTLVEHALIVALVFLAFFTIVAWL
jgi:AmpE protein